MYLDLFTHLCWKTKIFLSVIYVCYVVMIHEFIVVEKRLFVSHNHCFIALHYDYLFWTLQLKLQSFGYKPKNIIGRQRVTADIYQHFICWFKIKCIYITSHMIFSSYSLYKSMIRTHRINIFGLFLPVIIDL